MLKGFRRFISRGNAIDLAVGVIIGTAFGRVVNSLVGDVILPVIGRLFGEPDFSNLVIWAPVASAFNSSRLYPSSSEERRPGAHQRGGQRWRLSFPGPGRSSLRKPKKN